MNEQKLAGSAMGMMKRAIEGLVAQKASNIRFMHGAVQRGGSLIVSSKAGAAPLISRLASALYSPAMLARTMKVSR